MDILQINVKGWPPEWIETVKKYTDDLAAKFEGNGQPLEAVPNPDLPEWPGISSVPPEGLSRRELYKDEAE